MATELVDASKLDACCTAEANAIRAKTGSSSQIAYDWANSKGFADAIAAIPSGGGSLKYEIGSFTLASDMVDNYNPGISHGLGIAPKVVVVWTNDFSTSNPPSSELNYGFIYLVDIVNMQQQFSSSSFGDYPLFAQWWMSTVPTILTQNVTSESYAPTVKPTSSVFYLPKRGGNKYWRANVTYKYFVSEAWWS